MRTTVLLIDRPPVGIGAGVVGGLVAGLVFLVAEMVMNAAMGRAALGPFRLIASIVLGPAALGPGFALAPAMITGALVHALLSALYGVAFVGILAALEIRRSTGLSLVVAGAVFGAVLWVVNFRALAPALVPQVLLVNPIWNGFIAHTVFYGAVLGAWLAVFPRLRRASRVPNETRPPLRRSA